MDLVVVRLIQGENLPTNQGKLSFKISCGQNEADLEQVCCSDNVVINQEVAFLASELDKRTLQLEKLTLFSTLVSSNGTNLAYDPVSLPFDIKSIPSKKWYKLRYASSRNMTREPSILIAIFRESHKETPNGDSAMNQSDKSDAAEVLETDNGIGAQPRPVLVDDEYFLIQDQTDTDEQVFFNMSVTISFAENLFYLFPSRSLWPSENIPFEFRFSLFGSPIRFQPFKCLRNLTEIGERATAKLKGSPKCVLHFLKQSMQTLTIVLFCEDIAIAETVLPIKERIEYYLLEQQILEKLHLEPLNISGIFPVVSLLETEANKVDSNPMRPQIGVIVTVSEAQQRTNQPTNNKTYTAPAACSPSSVISPGSTDICSGTVRFSSKKRQNPQRKKQEDIFYATALELEVWKEEQKLLEQEKRERSRTSYMELLNSEYCRQAAVKEAAFQRRVCRIEELEKQLENAIQNARDSELQLRQEKEHLSRQRAQLAREKSAVTSEVERVTLSLTTKHKFELEAEKRRHTEIVTELRRKLKAETQKSSDGIKKIVELEKELCSFKLAL